MRMPMDNTIPNIVKTLIENPNASMAPNVPRSATGTTIVGMSVARKFWRNRYITRNTSAMASTRVMSTSSIEIRTKVDVSSG